MKSELATKYDSQIPRYTSYPTAPYFSEAVTGEDYASWLGKLDPANTLSLYHHIPFCDSMCWFCGCYTKIVKRYEPVREYLDVLLNEIDLVADALPGRFTARHLHWGGGSPTMLKGSDWTETMERIRSRFDIAENAEIAIELDPRTTTEDYVEALFAAGVNRASIGVQDFDPEVQKAINRIQPFSVTKQAIDWLRKHGIDNINMDLMYGLPYQTIERVVRQADLALSLRPARIALFGYGHVPWMKSHQKMIDEAALPDIKARFEQFTAAADRLVEAGYVAIGLDHFALPEDELSIASKEGRLHRNFQGYTSDAAGTLLGLGASAIGYLPQGYVQNSLPFKEYRTAIDEGRFATKKGLAFSAEDRLRADVIECLMCNMAVDIDVVAAKHGKDRSVFTKDLEKLAPMAEDGLIQIDGGRVVVTPGSQPFARLVAANFDAYLERGLKRYSKAI